MSFAAIASPNEMDHSLVNNKIIIMLPLLVTYLLLA